MERRTILTPLGILKPRGVFAPVVLAQVLVVTISLSALSDANAQQRRSVLSRFAAGVSIGTTGVGPEVQFQLAPRLVLRGGFDYLDFEVNETFDDVDYSADFEFANFQFGADLHPFKNSFFLTAGAMVGDKGLSLDGELNGPVEIGDTTFTPEEVGTLTGSADFKNFAPFVGLGYDNTFSGGRLGFRASAGVLFGGSPDVALVSNGGTLSNDPTFQAELREEEQALEDEIDAVNVYPLFSLGLRYRFN